MKYKLPFSITRLAYFSTEAEAEPFYVKSADKTVQRFPATRTTARRKRRESAQSRDERRMGLRPGTFTSKPYGGEFKGQTKWAAKPGTDPYTRHTYYMVLEVEGSARGIAYEYEDIDADAPDQYATLGLVGVTSDGRIRGLKYAELVRNFEAIATKAIRRAGVFPKGGLKESVVAVFRHKEK